MNPEIKERWLEALRSGKYKQGQKLLRARDVDGNEYHCCLGVLCDLAVEAGVTTVEYEPESHDDCVIGLTSYLYADGEDGQSSGLPQVVCEWSGVNDMLGAYGNAPVHHGASALAFDNDGGNETRHRLNRLEFLT